VLDGTYNGLVASVADWLVRPDLNATIPDLIIAAELSLSDREEISYERDDAITLSASPMNLPTDCREVKLLYFDEPAYYELEIVDEGLLALWKGGPNTSPGNTGQGLNLPGRPRYAAIGANGQTLYLAPAPDQAYVANIKYITKLLASKQGSENWLLTTRPDIYLFAALVESAPYLKDDARIQVWQGELEKRLANMAKLSKRRLWANTTIWKPRRAIG
jgi:hypothetical protein